MHVLEGWVIGVRPVGLYALVNVLRLQTLGRMLDMCVWNSSLLHLDLLGVTFVCAPNTTVSLELREEDFHHLVEYADHVIWVV
ncbi:MAG: hypothetical protein NPIRA05_19690 [Nitrospirales bacterium]|nr:MAG: hypothetical protein NPIRA05_19690 [Nitrospirales bacterium]